MTKKYDLSKIMSTAWALYRAATTATKCFGDFLRAAWAKAKMGATMIVTWSDGRNVITLDAAKGTIKGGTYPMRDIIKREFAGAKWDSSAKAWRVDPAIMTDLLTSLKDYYTRLYSMTPVSQPTNAPIATARPSINAVSSSKINGRCKRCGTYCCGDCRA